MSRKPPRQFPAVKKACSVPQEKLQQDRNEMSITTFAINLQDIDFPTDTSSEVAGKEVVSASRFQAVEFLKFPFSLQL